MDFGLIVNSKAIFLDFNFFVLLDVETNPGGNGPISES